jgi:hypothetical protein
MTFTFGDLKTGHKQLNPSYANVDSTKYNAWALFAIAPTLATMQATYIGGADPHVRGSTIADGSPLSTGTEVVDTDLYDAFKIALPAAASKLASNTIWVYNDSTDEFEAIPRVEIDSIILTGDNETIRAFYEVNGFIILVLKDAEFGTIPADVHTEYWRNIAIPDDDADVIDAKREDWDTVMGLFSQYMPVL